MLRAGLGNAAVPVFNFFASQEKTYSYCHDIIATLSSMKKISLYVGEEQWRQLNKLARSEGRKTSELVRQAITDFILAYKLIVKGKPKKKGR